MGENTGTAGYPSAARLCLYVHTCVGLCVYTCKNDLFYDAVSTVGFKTLHGKIVTNDKQEGMWEKGVMVCFIVVFLRSCVPVFA